MKKLLLFIISASCSAISIACTTFFINYNGQMVFGRNYDWLTETGVVYSNLRGVTKSGYELENAQALKWTSRYGSITFNQYGKEFPTGGMNEKGLVVELMWLSESEFPSPDERPALGVLQWIQYQLDNCSTIEEVEATDKMVRINPHGAPQHYLIADANGHAATIEFLKGKMVVHKGSSLPYPVLTNNVYEESTQAINKNGAMQQSLQFTDNSLQRFSTACSLVKQLDQSKIDKPLVDYSFDILNQVAQGNFTKWSIVYDINNKRIHFKTADYKDVKIVDMSRFDFSCATGSLGFNMNQDANGDVTKQFIAFSNELNKLKIREAFENSRSQIESDEKTEMQLAKIAEEVKCQ